jgi:diguanylate cyclase (GGDEF)-like protein
LLARSDALTGLANRIAFAERLDEALSQAKRNDDMLCVMYIDLDGFKTINDTRGHDAGDAVLRQVAMRLRRCVRDYDLVARLGGDELAVLAPNLAAADLEATAERISRTLAIPLDLQGGAAHVTASIGVASFPATAEEAVLLVKCADQAMYAAKRAGKGCVRRAEAARATPRPAAGTL